MTKLSRCSWWFSASIILVCPIETTLAQSYAARAIRLVVPYAPGGGADNVARVIAQKLSEALGQQVVIDNRGGAGGIIGADIVAKSAPDGYTLLHDASAHAVNPSLHKLPFDTLKDFAPEFPTVTESGLPGYEIYEWNAVFAPAGTPLSIITKLNAELRKVISTPDVQERFFQMGAEAAPGSPEHLDDYVRSEITKWGKVVKAMGIKVE